MQRPDNDFAADMRAVALSGDKIAFRRIFEFYGPKVRTYLMRLGAEATLADDLMQEVMLTVWTRAHQFDGNRAALSTWIFTIARNKRIDFLRKIARPQADLNDPTLDPPAPPRSDQLFEANEASDKLHEAIAELPNDQAEILRVFYLEEMTHIAISEKFNLPLGTVKSRIRLAIAKLKSRLEDIE